MVAVDRKDGYGDIEVWVFIIYRWKAMYFLNIIRIKERDKNTRKTWCFAFQRIAKQLDLDGFVAEGVFAEESSYLVETFSRRLILVKQIPTEENKIHIFLYSQPQNLFEGVDRILTAYWVALHIPNMVVRREQNSYRILGSCELLSSNSYTETFSDSLHPSCIPCVGRGGGVPSDIIGVSVISHGLLDNAFDCF